MKYIVMIATLSVLTLSIGCGTKLFEVGSDQISGFEIEVNQKANPVIRGELNTVGVLNWFTCLNWMKWANVCSESGEEGRVDE